MLAQEQRCGFRKSGSLVPLRHARGNFDIATRLKAVLIRRDVFKHLMGVFSRFSSEVAAFMDVAYYDQFDKSGAEVDDGEQPMDDDESVTTDVSSFTSKAPLLRLCTKLAKGHYELSLCRIATLGL